ncbi:MAG TPA: MBL fold metallo-hydrolase [Cyclobacteriaceae bacterium]|nr:MBL fold metallo-hydrolase [Cyclobacteriaceae bacterium]
MIIASIMITALVLATLVFLQQPQFGKTPSGERLARIQQSPHYRNGKFQNLSPTPDLSEGVGYYTVMKEFLFEKSKRSEPRERLPSKKTDLLQLRPDSNVLVWFGHSSYFIQIDGKKILVDPVFSGSASPIKFTTPSYPGSDVYTTDDIPEIDYLFISHDHWDHLDFDTLVKLKLRIKKVITGLGVGAHLEYWGYNKDIIVEKDWNEEVILDHGFTVNTTPARHFSGRGLKRMKSIWLSFVLQTPGMKIFMGGDSGYDTHFKDIGTTYGPFDLVLLECGQYNKNWKYIHMMPEEVIQAGLDLKAKRLMPVHWSKFTLGQHAWDEPVIRLLEANKKVNLSVLTPMIGEEINLNSEIKTSDWWTAVG